jgi:hypothetical protein
MSTKDKEHYQKAKAQKAVASNTVQEDLALLATRVTQGEYNVNSFSEIIDNINKLAEKRKVELMADPNNSFVIDLNALGSNIPAEESAISTLVNMKVILAHTAAFGNVINSGNILTAIHKGRCTIVIQNLERPIGELRNQFTNQL